MQISVLFEETKYALLKCTFLFQNSNQKCCLFLIQNCGKVLQGKISCQRDSRTLSSFRLLSTSKFAQSKLICTINLQKLVTDLCTEYASELLFSFICANIFSETNLPRNLRESLRFCREKIVSKYESIEFHRKRC